MPKKKALEIFNNLHSEDYTVGDKVEAIVEVASMPTHNSVKKAAMLDAIRYLANVLIATLAEAES